MQMLNDGLYKHCFVPSQTLPADRKNTFIVTKPHGNLMTSHVNAGVCLGLYLSAWVENVPLKARTKEGKEGELRDSGCRV